MKKRVLSLLLAVCAMLSLSIPAFASSFTDVPSDAWYTPAVEYVYANGLFNGVGNNRFNPDGKMTRAMFVQVLANATDNYDKEAYQTGPFTDVDPDEWYAPAVNWAADMGIVAGVGDNKFNPNGNVTRQEMAVIFYRYAAKTSNDLTFDTDRFYTFADYKNVSSWAKVGMVWATDKYIINGSNSNGKLSLLPLNDATRAEVAQVFMSAKDILVKRTVDKDIDVPSVTLPDDPDDDTGSNNNTGNTDRPTGGVDYSDVPEEDQWLFEGATTGELTFVMSNQNYTNYTITLLPESPLANTITYTTSSGETGTKYAAPTSASYPINEANFRNLTEAWTNIFYIPYYTKYPQYLDLVNSSLTSLDVYKAQIAQQEYPSLSTLIAEIDKRTSAQWGGVRDTEEEASGVLDILESAVADDSSNFWSYWRYEMYDTWAQYMSRGYTVAWNMTTSDQILSTAKYIAEMLEENDAEYWYLMPGTDKSYDVDYDDLNSYNLPTYRIFYYTPVEK